MADPAIEQLDPESSSLLRWMAYAADWEDHRDLDDELTFEEMERITAEIESEIEQEGGDQIRQDNDYFWLRDEYDVDGIVDDTLFSIGPVLSRPMHVGGRFGNISVEILPWRHERLFKEDVLGSFWDVSGQCERYERSEASGFDIILSSTATPATVLHEIAHMLAYGDEGGFFHGPCWLGYFIILMAGRYWELDLPEFILELHEARRPLTGSRTGS